MSYRTEYWPCQFYMWTGVVWHSSNNSWDYLYKWIILNSFSRTPISNIDRLQQCLDQYWEECPSEVRTSYGPEYLKEFKKTVSEHLSKAKPQEKVVEVINDLVDAVAGENPQVSCQNWPGLMRGFRVFTWFPNSIPIPNSGICTENLGFVKAEFNDNSTNREIYLAQGSELEWIPYVGIFSNKLAV